eukprot:SAG25_NODE_1097_length_4023_cov_1.143221_3_plen_177_part_00
MYYPLTRIRNSGEPVAPFHNCSVFGCTCKGAADYYGIAGGFGCADTGAQHWWIHEAKPCASPGSCCTVGDYTKKPPPYSGCKAVPHSALSMDVAGFLLIRGDYAWIGHGWQGCGQPPADEGGGYPFPAEMNRDFGEPEGLCAEATPGGGVYTRSFTRAIVTMDCNSGNATVVMKHR